MLCSCVLPPPLPPPLPPTLPPGGASVAPYAPRYSCFAACAVLAVTLSTFEQKEMSLPGPSNAAHMIRTKRELGHYTILLLALAFKTVHSGLVYNNRPENKLCSF